MREQMTEKLSRLLALRPGGQDWGIENADPSRLVEFIDFYNNYSPESSWESELLAELILQSAEEALEAKTFDDSLRAMVINFIYMHGKEFPIQLVYWSKLNKSEWPVVCLLEEAQHGA